MKGNLNWKIRDVLRSNKHIQYLTIFHDGLFVSICEYIDDLEVTNFVEYRKIRRNIFDFETLIIEIFENSVRFLARPPISPYLAWVLEFYISLSFLTFETFAIIKIHDSFLLQSEDRVVGLVYQI